MNEVIYLSEATAARRRVKLSLAVDATDGKTPETGLTGTGFYSANGAAGVATAASVVEVDAGDLPGQYYIELSGAEVTALGVGNHMLYYKNAAALACVAHFSIIPDDLWSASDGLDEALNELTSAPAIDGSSLRQMIQYLFHAKRNKTVTSDTAHIIKQSDGTTNLQSRTLSTTATDFTAES